jgi:hypothetical protein
LDALGRSVEMLLEESLENVHECNFQLSLLTDRSIWPFSSIAHSMQTELIDKAWLCFALTAERKFEGSRQKPVLLVE